MFNRIRSRIGERRVDIWVLLSDTDRFVSRANLLDMYEEKLREWRNELQNFSTDPSRIRIIRDEITEFRRARRQEGWELRLGSLDVQLKGFRSDDAMGVGFRRMVLKVNENGEVRFNAGSGNHIQLDEELNVELQHAPPAMPLDSHYLWYRRIAGILELAGADSQSQESHEQLKEYIIKHKSYLVKALYKLN